MPDPEPHVPGRKTEDPELKELGALDDAVRAIGDAQKAIASRLDALQRQWRKDDDRRRKADAADDRKDDRGDDRRDRHDDDSADDRKNDRRKDAKADDDDKDFEEWAEEESEEHKEQPTDPRELAADDDRRRRSRKDAAIADEESRRLLAQADYDAVFQALDGTRAPPPLAGERARSYRIRMMKQTKRFSPSYADIEVAKIEDPKLLALADRQIRADAMAVAHDPQKMQQYFGGHPGMLREVITTDSTGRRISRFYGPVGAENGPLAPFRLPAMRVRRINTNPDRDR